MSGRALKNTGMAIAANNRKELLERARNQVRIRASSNGTATADDIDKDLRVQLGPAAGSVFKSEDFEFTGDRVPSTMDSNHARELKVWRLTEVGKSKVKQPGTSPTRQAEDRTRRSPAPVDITELTHASLPSWLK